MSAGGNSARPRRHWTLEWSFTVSTVLLVMVLVGATILIVQFRLRTSLEQQLDLRGFSMARSIGAVATPSLLAYNYAALQIAADAASRDPGVAYVVIHDKEGAIAGAAGRASAAAGNAKPPPSGWERPSAIDVEVEAGTSPAELVREVSVPVRVDGGAEPWGTVRVGLSAWQMAEELRRIDLGLLGLGFALAIVAAGSARWVARQITAPLRRLVAGTEVIRAGDMSHRIPARGAKELADLAAAFNEMMERVEEKARESGQLHRQLESLNATLEEQVQERTRALGESEAQYKTLVDHSPDAILIVQDGRVRFVNPAFVETFGLVREVALLQEFKLASIFETASSRAARRRIADWERGVPAAPLEVRARDAAGKVRTLELRGSGIEYLGRPAAECLLIDTTEANELRERLNETEKLRSLGELAGGVAHDFNNLLSAILGRSQLLRRRGLPEPIDAELAVIETAAKDGRETVRRIQEFSRIRRDRRFGPVDLYGILRESLSMTETRWKEAGAGENGSGGIAIRLEGQMVPPIAGNAAELRELFINLVLNAVDAMPEGGSLRLSARSTGGKVAVEVEDTGVGMTESVRRHLFDPFFTTKGSQGMGLGLSMVYGIVQRHGGTIDVRTSPGAGTTFLLEFPIAEGLSASGDIPPRGDAEDVRKARILVIDDEKEIAELLRDVLRIQGHDVEIALAASEGVRKALSTPYDLVFTDLGLPDMSGWEVAGAIRAAKADLPVALVTGWAASIGEEEVRARGLAAMVHKPFEVSEVLDITAELLAEPANT